MKPARLALLTVALFACAVWMASQLSAQAPPDRCLVPAAMRDAILNEYSGEQAYLHVQLLAANRDRQPAEYTGTYFETDYISARAREAGLSDVRVEFFPGGEVWDAEEADLWLIEPVRKKIASLTMVPTALARGSASADVEAEVVYVGAGRPEDYAGKDVSGKIVLGNASVGSVFASAVTARGAAGALGTSSAGVSANSPGYSLDQLGWSSVRPGEAGGFGFVLSIRQMLELQSYAERGRRMVMRARVKTAMHPGRLNVVSAAIPGTDPAAGDLLFVAHAFETIATPGANDNCTGVGGTLEIGRTLARLIREGVLPQPRRTIRFLWVPEISGSRAWMFAHPELEDTLLAVLNYDMTGADLEKTDTYLRMKMTPDSVPSYLNDLIANLLQFVDQTEIRTQTGNNGPFNYRLVPFISNSDHMVFLPAGIPAMQFNHWPDNFYHSSEDTILNSDPTQMKRTGFMGAAAFYYLATAGGDEARALAWEAAANGEKWIAEVARQSVRLLAGAPDTIVPGYVAAVNKVDGALDRGRGAVESTRALADDPAVRGTIATLVGALEASAGAQRAKLEAVFRQRASALGVTAALPKPTPRELELDRQVPRRRFSVFSAEAQRRAGAPRPGGPGGSGLPSLAQAEVFGFIDGRRSILDIYRAVRAEYGQVTTSQADYKFAWVVAPELPDIGLDGVVAAIDGFVKDGTVEIVPRPGNESGAKKR
jgi:hypothetical protein